MKAFNSIQFTAYWVIILLGIGWIMHTAASIFVPFLYAVFFSIALSPLYKRVKSLFRINWISILISLLLFFLPIFLVGLLFSIQLVEIIDSLPTIQNDLKSGANRVIQTVQRYIPGISLDPKSEQLSSLISGPIKTIAEGIVSSTTALFSVLLIILYTFFLLLYQSKFSRFLLQTTQRDDKTQVKETVSEIQETVQSYIRGLGIVVLILIVMNSLGLWIIGVDYPLFWGTLAGLLAVIPFIGTVIGGLLPFIYTLASPDYSWQPMAVAGYYFLIQQIEGNIITPKIIGEQVNINPLFAILALLFFASFWGLAGIFIALPLVSIVRILLGHFDYFKPLAELMSATKSD